MHPFITLLSFVGVINAFSLLDPLEKRADAVIDNATTSALPSRYIVEFTKGTDAKAAVDELTRSGATVLKVFDSDVFVGASVESNVENIDTLQFRDSVRQAWLSKKITLAPAQPLKSYSDEATSLNYSVHGMTGVDKLHEAGITGKGVTVAVVDTGVDYTHSVLGGGFGPGFKVAGGYDLVGDGTWPVVGEVKVPDNDPMDQLGHGTHVSGIIAGSGVSFKGVAPDANILIYKVFGQLDGTDEETLIDAFIMAYEAGADIITSSIGGDDGWVTNAWALVATRLVDLGIVVTISAGNSGTSGPIDASNGSSGEHVLAIASVEATSVAAPSFKATFTLDSFSNTTKIGYLSNYVFSQYIDSLPIVPLTLDTSIADDACSELEGETRDFSNSIVLVRRGGCTFATKQANLEAYGGVYILFYTDDLPLNIPLSDIYYGITAMISSAAGEAIINTVKEGGNITTDFTGTVEEIAVSVPNLVTPGVVNAFTSLGPTNELFIKPDIAAPGGDIFSSYLGGGFAILSGTSMACPYVAGVAALYISQHGGRSIHGAGFAKDLAMRIISSGKSLTFDDGTGTGTEYDFFAPVAQVGTGLIDAVKVLNYETSLSFSKFHLNDTHHFQRYHSVDITNNGNEAVTYSFELQDSAAVQAMQVDPSFYGAPRLTTFQEAFANPIKAVPQVSLPGGTFSVGAGQTKTAKFSFNAPTGLDPKTIPIYSGKIIITGSNEESLSVPYLGLAADIHNDVSTVFPTAYYPPRFFSRYKSGATLTNATFNLLSNVMDFPILVSDIQWPTIELRWDIFESSWAERDWVYPPVVGENGYVGSATYYPSATSQYFNPISAGGTDDPDLFVAYPLKNVARTPWNINSIERWWLGKLANGTQIAPGEYKMRIAGLMPFAEPTHANSWDVLSFQDFEVLPL